MEGQGFYTWKSIHSNNPTADTVFFTPYCFLPLPSLRRLSFVRADGDGGRRLYLAGERPFFMEKAGASEDEERKKVVICNRNVERMKLSLIRIVFLLCKLIIIMRVLVVPVVEMLLCVPAENRVLPKRGLPLRQPLDLALDLALITHQTHNCRGSRKVRSYPSAP